LATTDDIFTKAKGLTFKSIRDDSVKVTKFVVNPLTDVDQEITFLLFLTLRDRAQTRLSSWQNVPNSPIMKIQDIGGNHIEFRKMSIYTDWIFAPNLVGRYAMAIMEMIT